MFAATRVINPGPTRIGQIGNSFTLPRTVPIVVLIACAIGFQQEWHVEEERPIGSGDGNGQSGDVESGSLAGAS